MYGFGKYYPKKFHVIKLGAKPKLPHFTSNQTLHCFPLNGIPENPECF